MIGWPVGRRERQELVDRLTSWPVDKDETREANERGMEGRRAGGHEGGNEAIRVRGRVRDRGRRCREARTRGHDS